MDGWGLTALGLATLAGALVQATTGFGFAILAAPVFLAVMNSKAAIPVLVALHIVQSAMLAPKLWTKVSRWHLYRLAAGAAIGCPLGLLLLGYLDVRGLKLTLGVLILLALVLFVVRGRMQSAGLRHPQPERGPLTAMTGLASGALTSILVMPGPPLMAYLAGERWPRDASRALSLTFFAGCYVLVFALALAAGTVAVADWWLILVLAPASLLGTLAGLRLAPRISEAHFRQAILALMLLSGLGAIVSAL
ncbi:MAG: sulfite exporter TauE/SafE family protein [Hyphomicrobiaceae bacterium]